MDWGILKILKGLFLIMFNDRLDEVMVLTWSKVEAVALSQSEATSKKKKNQEPVASLWFPLAQKLPADSHFPFHPSILTHSHFALQLYSPHSLLSSLLRQIFAVVFFFSGLSRGVGWDRLT